jgi:CRISPR-associated endoribonuclease Cas6
MYRVLHESDADFTGWLHDHGYQIDGKQFRLFTFSQLDLRPYQIQGDLVQLNGDRISLEVSFCLKAVSGLFLQGLFAQQQLSLGDAQHRVDFLVDTVEILPAPAFREEWQRFRCLSPVCVSLARRDGRPVEYLSPDHPRYAERLYDNLISKIQSYLVAQGCIPEPAFPYFPEIFGFRLESRPRSRLIRIAPNTERTTQVRGFLFDFSLRCDSGWKKMMWQAGLGEKNAMGFGCVGF